MEERWVRRRGGEERCGAEVVRRRGEEERWGGEVG